MNRFDGLARWAWSVLVVCTLAFALGGCSGDDGRDGADGTAGAAGADGTDGTDGTDGADGASATITPLESCGVCHDAGSFASAPAHHALPQIEAVTNVAFAVNGADLDVTFDLAVDGAPGLGYDTIQSGYRQNGTDSASISGDLSALTDNNDGSYSFAITDGNLVAGDNRYLFRVAMADDVKGVTPVYFWGDFPAPVFETPIVSADACGACHGPEGIHVHGGYYQAADVAEPCLVCHGGPAPWSGAPVASLAEVAHGYHNGNRLDDGEPVHTTYPTYMANCSVCHSEASELAAANAMRVTGPDCFTCHGGMDSASWDFTDTQFHLTNIPDPATHDCQTACHTAGGLAATKIVVAEFHDGWETARHGFIYGGVDTSIVEGDKFDWAITGMVDDGVNLTFTWQASYDGVGVDPCNTTVGVGAPVFHAGVDAAGDPIGGLRTYRSYAQGDDFIIGTSTSAPGQPSQGDVDAINTTCASMIATTVIPVEAVVADKGRIALGGKALVESPDVAGLIVQSRVPSPTFDWEIGDGTAVARRAIVDTELCLDCHVGSMYQHGGDRVDNVDYCLVCHNAASNEQNVREGAMGIDPADTYDGQVGETYEMKTMIHRIHSAGEDGSPPYVIYRGRGIYGFAPDVADMGPNWPGTGSQVAFGSTIANDGTPGSFVVNHNFHTPTYPRGLYDCAACHVDGTDVQPDQREAMASTREAGSTTWDDQVDDVLEGAATTACVTCHADGPARGHAYQNSWEPQEFPEGRETIIDAAN